MIPILKVVYQTSFLEKYFNSDYKEKESIILMIYFKNVKISLSSMVISLVDNEFDSKILSF